MYFLYTMTCAMLCEKPLCEAGSLLQMSSQQHPKYTRPDYTRPDIQEQPNKPREPNTP